MIWDTLSTKKGIADARIREAQESMSMIKEELGRGVSMSIARTIIKTIWGESSDAKKLLARLVVNFPSENSSTIMYAPLPPYAVANLLGDMKPAVQYVLDAHEYIERTVGVVLAKLNQFDINDPLGLDAVNEFRKNVLTYIEGVKYCSFELSVEEVAETPTWKDYIVDSQCIEDGDYLMMTEFEVGLKEAHNRFLERRNKDVHYSDDYTSLYGVKWEADRYLAELNITQLFAEYLNELVVKLEIVLDM